MSSIKELNNNIMNIQNSIFSYLKNESDSETEDCTINKEPVKEPVKELVKELVKEEKSNYNIKKTYINLNKENKSSKEWTSVESEKNKKFYKLINLLYRLKN